MKYKAPFCVGTMGAGQLRQLVLMAAAAGKPYNRSSPDGNAPFWCLRHHLSPEGGLLVPLCNEQLKLTQGESIEQTFPSGGSTAAGGDRGAFPSGHRPGLPIFPPVRAVVKVLSKWRRRRPPPPSEPFEPYESSRPKGVSKKGAHHRRGALLRPL